LEEVKSSDMKIETATIDDYDQLRTLFHAAYIKYVQRIGKEPEPMTTDYRPKIERGLVFVIRKGATIIGAVVLENRESFLDLRTLAVSPEHQGKGLGRQLLKFAEEEAVSRFSISAGLSKSSHPHALMKKCDGMTFLHLRYYWLQIAKNASGALVGLSEIQQ
jgi:GNAT superfamily N-acetyltransferase